MGGAGTWCRPVLVGGRVLRSFAGVVGGDGSRGEAFGFEVEVEDGDVRERSRSHV